MRIAGLQKMTLLDFPGKVACTVFTAGCDFRCPFCHNYELTDRNVESVMTEEEFLRFLGRRKGLIDGVAVTGGEPCMQQDLPEFLAKIRDLGFLVKLDTNGNHPEVLERILDEGLADYVAMDVKNSPDRYAETSGLLHMDLSRIGQSIRLLMRGETDHEFRTTVVEELHGEEEIRAVCEWISGARRYYLQPFTDRDTVPYDGFHAPSRDAMKRYLDIASGYVMQAEIRGMD